MVAIRANKEAQANLYRRADETFAAFQKRAQELGGDV